ncbi:type IV secretion system DNA-binding domain-containing protein [Yonghaparkia sp. Root332]|uniref:type IV secretion system DNA-binding domain-containing protein n=1 Tax=Yonghaparkia sp. Root332 TaxID=1736516 RepID=UPI0012E3CABD|nr:type IV secretion system DNA-binding domain-containing protein [Yonghaparkia sp. Root332]
MSADDALVRRFVELKPGLIATLLAPVNHLLTGRRGVGKSTTLALLQKRAEEVGDWVIFVDIETHKDRLYPDVLIEIVLEILDAVSPRWTNFRAWKIRRDVRDLSSVLRSLRDAPEVQEEHRSSEATDLSSTTVTLSGAASKKYAAIVASAARGSRRLATVTKVSKTIKRKDSVLRDLAPAISSLLERATKSEGKRKLLLVLDDFYFISQDRQPLVLDHLHGITKRSRVWLKIGSVHSRTRSYVEGDPPRGMQPPNDFQHVSLDLGLSEFKTAKSFLEDIADGVLAPHGLNIRNTLTDTARERAVLVAGGAVARDYFDLLIASADAEWEQRQGGPSPVGKFRIGAESVQAAAGRMLERKQTDLRNDAGQDVAALDSRFADLVSFVRDRDTYFFLVKRADLDSDWGRQIVQLEDLRFVHRIMQTRPNAASMRKVDTVVFMVDIPALVDKRMQKLPVEFWKPRMSDELRKARWVYAPEWSKA